MGGAILFEKLGVLSAGQTQYGLTKVWYGNYNNEVKELGGSSSGGSIISLGTSDFTDAGVVSTGSGVLQGKKRTYTTTLSNTGLLALIGTTFTISMPITWRNQNDKQQSGTHTATYNLDTNLSITDTIVSRTFTSTYNTGSTYVGTFTHSFDITFQISSGIFTITVNGTASYGSGMSYRSTVQNISTTISLVGVPT